MSYVSYLYTSISHLNRNLIYNYIDRIKNQTGYEDYNNLNFYIIIVILYKNKIDFVKIILLKNDNCALMLRKRLFCNAKPTLLPCKTAAFGMQNNRFYNTLIYR